MAFVALSVIVLRGSPVAATVQLEPATAAAGSIADLTFHVVNDRADAFTKSVQVVFPGAPKFESAQATAPAGWTSSVDQQLGPVSSVTFEAAKIEGSGSADFVITTAVPLTGDRAIFTVLQTYSDGRVERWGVDPAKDPGNPALAVVLGIEGGATTTTVPVTPTTLQPAGGGNGGLPTPSAGNVFIAIGIAMIVALTMRSRRLKKRQK